MRLRRFSQLGWHGCQDLAGFVMGSEVERVELGPPPADARFEIGEIVHFDSVEDMIEMRNGRYGDGREFP